ncbi:hypothetical protein [Actinomadura miaoliensis]|uniref:DUF4352 domain-containing protein n=1 Tax=Actinomadura miaoliensis TaxID=430685 RepID=A0ABP7WNF7_9ACTN
MPRSVSRPSRPIRQARRVAGSGLTLTLAFALAVTGCSGDEKKADKPGPPPPAPSQQSESEANAAPGAQSMRLSQGLRKPVTYDDKITVQVTGIRKVRNQNKGPGEMTGRTLTIFTLRFTNGSPRPLDLNQVRVVARYGAKGTQASPTSYANLNDFYGTVAPGKTRSASYAFDLPSTGYGKVVLGVKFSETHKVALFTGAIET